MHVVLLQASVVLAVAQQHHPHSPGLLLALSAVQTLLGNAERAVESFMEVSPRSVQLDSLAHHVSPVLAELPTRTTLRHLRMARHPPFLSSFPSRHQTWTNAASTTVHLAFTIACHLSNMPFWNCYYHARRHASGP